MGNRETKTRKCQKMEREFILLIRAMKSTKTPTAAAMPCKRSFSQATFRKPLSQKQKKAKASEAKTRVSCIAEAHESTRQRTESVTKRIHEEHIAGKGQNSVVHCSLFAKQLKPREGPKVTLRNTWVYTSSNVLREPRWTESKLQIWDSDPIPSESRSWPDEDAKSFFSFLIQVHEFVPMRRSQESSSPIFLKVKACACCLVSRHSVSVGQNSSSNPKSPGSTRYSQVWTWEERSTNSGCCSVRRASRNRELHSSEDSGGLSLRDVSLGKPRACAKISFTPSKSWFQMQKQQWTRNERRS